MSWLFGGWPALSANEQAAWLQAIGSVIGIGVAIAVPWWQRRSERADQAVREARRARSLGTVVIRELRTLERRMESEMRKLKTARDHELIEVSKRAIPQLLWDKADDLHLLGAPGSKVLLAIFQIFEARAHTHPFGSSSGPVVSPEDRDKYAGHIAAALTYCREAIRSTEILLSSE